MTNWLGWLLAGLAVGAGALAVVWYALQGRRSDARRASVDMMVAWHARDFKVRRARIADLMQDFEQNAVEVRELASALEQKRLRLEADYADKGLSVDEIADRFNRIRP